MWEFIKSFFNKNIEDKKGTSSISQEMKYLIVGLGNVGEEYDDTRHNIGFEVVDQLAKAYSSKWKNETLGFTADFKHKGRQFHLLKPTTYMNRSGKSLNYWMNKHKIKIENVLVIVDDLNLEFGKIRLRAKGAAGGHNGLKDIEQVLGTSKYARLKIGIGANYNRGRQVDFVLGKWNKKELESLSDIVQNATQACLSYGTIGLNHTMNSFNK